MSLQKSSPSTKHMTFRPLQLDVLTLVPANRSAIFQTSSFHNQTILALPLIKRDCQPLALLSRMSRQQRSSGARPLHSNRDERRLGTQSLYSNSVSGNQVGTVGSNSR